MARRSVTTDSWRPVRMCLELEQLKRRHKTDNHDKSETCHKLWTQFNSSSNSLTFFDDDLGSEVTMVADDLLKTHVAKDLEHVTRDKTKGSTASQPTAIVNDCVVDSIVDWRDLTRTHPRSHADMSERKLRWLTNLTSHTATAKHRAAALKSVVESPPSARRQLDPDDVVTTTNPTPNTKELQSMLARCRSSASGVHFNLPLSNSTLTSITVEHGTTDLSQRLTAFNAAIAWISDSIDESERTRQHLSRFVDRLHGQLARHVVDPAVRADWRASTHVPQSGEGTRRMFKRLSPGRTGLRVAPEHLLLLSLEACKTFDVIFDLMFAGLSCDLLHRAATVPNHKIMRAYRPVTCLDPLHRCHTAEFGARSLEILHKHSLLADTQYGCTVGGGCDVLTARAWSHAMAFNHHVEIGTFDQS